jgi:glycosyltransferase 2 family protein
MLRRMRRWLPLVLRLVGTAAGLTWIALTVDLEEAGAALARISIATFALAALLVAANVVVGAVRWHVLMRAYGATEIPPLSRLVYLYFVAFFYNNYLPGAVAGDVGRGVVTRGAFGEAGATGALAVVVVERALGLFALFALLALGLLTAGQSIDTGSLWVWTAIGCAGSCALVAAIPASRRLARVLPGPLRRIAEKLPELRDGKQFAFAIVLSLGTQVFIALAGWLILAALAPVAFTTSLLVVPLAAATTFLPITVGGTGAREAAYVELCKMLGMAKGPALAASLGLWLAHLVVGAIGGVAQLAGRRRTP